MPNIHRVTIDCPGDGALLFQELRRQARDRIFGELTIAASYPGHFISLLTDDVDFIRGLVHTHGPEGATIQA